jgi:kynurenine formamidase
MENGGKRVAVLKRSDFSVIYDISPPITELLSVWPGDTPPRREVLMDIACGDSVTLSTLHATVHLGAHADAPSHYGPGAADISSRSLELYLGRCQLIRVVIPKGGLIRPEHLKAEILEPRVLIHTGTFPDPSVFSEDFALGIAAESPQRSEDLQRKARPAGARPNIPRHYVSAPFKGRTNT